MLHYNDEFYHHGILGQKWGKMNGPPYPIDPSDHSAAEKKAGWRESLSSDKHKDPSDDYKNSRRKDLENMTNDELRNLIQRLQLEKQYGDITKVEVEKGKGAVEKFIDMAKPIAVASGIALTIYKNYKQFSALSSGGKGGK